MVLKGKLVYFCSFSVCNWNIFFIFYRFSSQIKSQIQSKLWMFPLLLSTVVSCVCKHILHVTYTHTQQKLSKPLSWVCQHHCKWYCIGKICIAGHHYLNLNFTFCFECKIKILPIPCQDSKGFITQLLGLLRVLGKMTT